MLTVNTTTDWAEITWTGSSLFVQNQGNYNVEVFLGVDPTILNVGVILGGQSSEFSTKELVITETIRVWVRSVGLSANPSKLVYHAAA